MPLVVQSVHRLLPHRGAGRVGSVGLPSCDGGGVQLFYGTVIILRMIYYDINFVVEMSDNGGLLWE